MDLVHIQRLPLSGVPIDPRGSREPGLLSSKGTQALLCVTVYLRVPGPWMSSLLPLYWLVVVFSQSGLLSSW